MEDDGEGDGPQVGVAGTDISSTSSGDVQMLEGQDQELVTGSVIPLILVALWGR
jgi:hypothetical protein